MTDYRRPADLNARLEGEQVAIDLWAPGFRIGEPGGTTPADAALVLDDRQVRVLYAQLGQILAQRRAERAGQSWPPIPEEIRRLIEDAAGGPKPPAPWTSE